MVFEIERRFVFIANIDRLLNKIGAKLSKTCYQHDTYFDTVNNSLMQNDIWLRQRNTKWELKYGHYDSSLQQTNAMYTPSVYNEEDDLYKIALYLANVLKVESIDIKDDDTAVSLHDFNKWIKTDCEISELCEFNTKKNLIQ